MNKNVLNNKKKVEKDCEDFLIYIATLENIEKNMARKIVEYNSRYLEECREDALKFLLKLVDREIQIAGILESKVELFKNRVDFTKFLGKKRRFFLVERKMWRVQV